jgi:hypothetical protein
MLTEVKRSSHAFIQSYTTAVVSRERVRGTRRPSLFATNTPRTHTFMYTVFASFSEFTLMHSRVRIPCVFICCVFPSVMCVCVSFCVFMCVCESGNCVYVCVFREILRVECV